MDKDCVALMKGLIDIIVKFRSNSSHMYHAPKIILLRGKHHSRRQLPSCGLVIFIDVNTYLLLTEGRSLETFLKESYTIPLEVVIYLRKC